MSGKLDGWGTEWEGEVVKKTITKKAKKKDGSGFYNYNADVIDKTKTTLRARIIIRRKDWSQPYISRWMRLVDEMKDTPFWHDDPYGMLEKNCIRDHMQKVFRQECRGIVDQSREVNIPEYQVVGDTPVETPHAPANQMELLGKAKECDTLLNSFSMVSSETASYRDMIKSAIAEKDLVKLEHIAQTLQERKNTLS